jgi:hypothetical protein
MGRGIEVLCLGPARNVFQVSDGTRFGVLEFEAGDADQRERRLQHPHVIAYLQRWLDKEGAFIGSQDAPRLEWIHVEMAVVAARA